MNILITGTGRSGTKAVQLYLTLALLQKHDQVHLNYEPYLWKTRKGVFSFEGLRHHNSDSMFPKSEGELSGRHRRYFERLSQVEAPVVTKCIRGLGRMPFLRKALQADAWIHVVRDLYAVLESLERQEWNLYEIEPPVFPHKNIDLWPQVLEGLDVFELPSGLKSHLSQAKTEIDKNAVCWYLDNLAVLQAQEGPDLVLSYEKLSGASDVLLKNVGLYPEDMPLYFSDIRGSQIRNDDLFHDTDKGPDRLENLKHQWNRVVFSQKWPISMTVSEQMGTKVHLNADVTPKHLPTEERPKSPTLPRTDFLNQLNADIMLRT